MLNRRSLFAAGVAVVASAAPIIAVASPASVQAPMSANEAQLLFWEREAARIYEVVNSQIMSEDESEAMINLAAEYEAKIAEAPCDSHLAATIKLRTVVKEALCGGAMYRVDYASLIGSIVGFMERPA